MRHALSYSKFEQCSQFKRRRALTFPAFDFLFFQLVHLDIGIIVAVDQNVDEVGNREHADEDLLVRIPERSRSNSCGSVRKRE